MHAESQGNGPILGEDPTRDRFSRSFSRSDQANMLRQWEKVPTNVVKKGLRGSVLVSKMEL